MPKRGKFIVIDGIDGSGKGTQFKILKERLEREGYEVETFDFPQYGQKSASLVEEYLNGEYGTAEEVGPYAGSLFYAVDRFAAKKRMIKALEAGKIVISNRYVSASKGHQTSKIDDKIEREKYISWLNELEYEQLGIPVPDITIFLHVPVEISSKLILNKPEREYIKKTDIHETDVNHLKRSEAAYLEMANGLDKKENWITIDCCENDQILPVEDIAEKIYEITTREGILVKNRG